MAKRVLTETPAVFKADEVGWSNWRIWTPDYVRSRSGHRRVPIEMRALGSVFPFGSTEMTLDEFFTRIKETESGVSFYAAEVNTIFFLPELHEDIPTLLCHSGRRHQSFFYAGYNPVTPFHYHERSAAVLIQLHGTKRVLIGSPSVIKADYNWLSYRRNFSNLTLDYTQLRSKTNLELSEVKLNPGEALFIPVHWWHAVWGDGPTISVTIMWQDSFFKGSPVKTIRAVAAWAAESVFVWLLRLLPNKRIVSALCRGAQRVGAVRDGERLTEEIQSTRDTHSR